MENTANTLNEKGIAAFQESNYDEAAKLFQQAADAHTKAENYLDAAEALNNLSVVLVKAKRAEEALNAVEGTEKIFEDAGDLKRKAMALGNKAAALQELGKTDEAISLYNESIDIFHDLGEDDLKTASLQAISEIKLRKGQMTGTALDAIDALISNPNPTLLQKILKFFFRRFAKL
jgi:tetratricopeptide (TPR) repeat protein